VLKPGGHLLSFGGTRTAHRLAAGIEDAGFEIRDAIEWLYGSGFPKSRNLDGEHEGWGTALKPGHEPIIVARKPLFGTVQANMAEFGVGAINIAGCRVPGERGDGNWTGMDREGKGLFVNSPQHKDFIGEASDAGRWPPNVVMSHSHDCDESHCEGDCPIAQLDGQSGQLISGANPSRRGSDKSREVYGSFGGQSNASVRRGKDVGGASRFFYVAKASRRERDLGLDDLDERPLLWSSGTKSPGTFQSEGTNRKARNYHPTVKPIELMRHLARLVTPRGGALLDPFCGSGTTGVAAVLEGFEFIGIERERDYVEIARRRIEHFGLNPPTVEDRSRPDLDEQQEMAL
jgi:site-specific DNA-methyltransferase (adenine-specific)